MACIHWAGDGCTVPGCDGDNGPRPAFRPGFVWDGYFWSAIVADSGDGWLTVRTAGHVCRVRKDQVAPEGPAGFPTTWAKLERPVE